METRLRSGCDTCSLHLYRDQGLKWIIKKAKLSEVTVQLNTKYLQHNVSYIYSHIFIINGYVTNSQHDHLHMSRQNTSNIMMFHTFTFISSSSTGTLWTHSMTISQLTGRALNSWVRIPFKSDETFFQALFSQLPQLHTQNLKTCIKRKKYHPNSRSYD